VLYYIEVTKFVKLAYIGKLEDFRVLYYIKVTEFFKLANVGLLGDYCVLCYIKVTKFVKIQILEFWKIFVCYILHKSHEVR